MLFFSIFNTILAGCNNTSSSLRTYENSPLLPMNSALFLPSADTGDIKVAMRAYFESVNAPNFSQYSFVKRDLNRDFLKDALIYVTTPYGRWCNMDGCTLLILRGHIGGFSVVGTFKSVRSPFYISKAKSQGWHDIVIESSGSFYKDAETYIVSYDEAGYKRPLEQPYTFSRDMIDASILP